MNGTSKVGHVCFSIKDSRTIGIRKWIRTEKCKKIAQSGT